MPESLAIARAGAGVNTIDVAAASRRGIYVSNCPGKNAVAVAELTFALMLALDRRVADNVIDLKSGKWNKKELQGPRAVRPHARADLFGNIGQEVATRARAFGMPVLVWSRRFSSNATAPAGDRAMGYSGDGEREEVAAHADVISIHLALSKDTRGFVDAEILGQVKKGAMLINTARAEVLDYAALADAVYSGPARRARRVCQRANRRRRSLR